MSRVAWRAFDLAFAPYKRRALASILLTPPNGGLPDGPLAFVANHTSWWDGFLLRELQRRFAPASLPFTVMLDRELRVRPFLRALGAVGIEPGHAPSLRDAIRKLEKARTRHGDRFCLFYFPQGRIWPSHRRPLGFVPGFSRVVARLAPITVVPVALHLEPLDRPAPTACVRACDPIPVEPGVPGPGERRLETIVQAELDRIHSLAAESGERLVEAWA